MDSQTGIETRVKFDFEIDFLNGGGLQGQDFRLDIARDDIGDEALARAVVADLRLLMVKAVRITNKSIIREPHKRDAGALADGAGGRSAVALSDAARLVDLSHAIEDGMVTYPGIPAPHVCDFLSREASKARYAPGTQFQVGRIDLVANTGTYIDSPFHRFEEGADISMLPLRRLAGIDAVVVRVLGSSVRAIDALAFSAIDVAGKAVLVHTDWSRHWRTPHYFGGHPYLTGAAAAYLRDQGAALVGIDSLNIDDTADGHRPVHTTLLGAGIPIVEHLCGLERLPLTCFAFSAVPAPVRGMGTFPVRAYAALT
jgi:kynurenine formamidase